MIRLAPLTAASLLVLAACAPDTPQEAAAANLRDVADEQAEAVMADAENGIAGMEAEAEALMNNAGTTGSFEAKRMAVRAEAIRKEAELVREQAEAKARAIRAEGEAKARAVLAQ